MFSHVEIKSLSVCLAPLSIYIYFSIKYLLWETSDFEMFALLKSLLVTDPLQGSRGVPNSYHLVPEAHW